MRAITLRILILASLGLALTAGDPPATDPSVPWLRPSETGPKPTELFYRIESGDFQYFVLVRGFAGYGNVATDRLGQARVAIYDRAGALQIFYSAPVRAQDLVWRIEAEASVPWGPRVEGWVPDSFRLDWEIQADGDMDVEVHDGFSKPTKGKLAYIADERHPVRIALHEGAIPALVLPSKESSP